MFWNKSINDFHFKNGGFRTAVVSIFGETEARASLPSYYANRDFYGSIQWIPCSNDFEDAGLLVLTDLFYTEGHKKFIRQYRGGQWSNWDNYEYTFGIGNHSNYINNTTLDDFRFISGGVRFAEVAITGGEPVSSVSTPDGYLYGCVQWIQTNVTEGKQIAWGVAPNKNSQRIYTNNTWSAWTDL